MIYPIVTWENRRVRSAFERTAHQTNSKLVMCVPLLNAPHNAKICKLPYNLSMPDYRRLHGGYAYYFTVVTYNRLPILTGNQSRMALNDAWKIVEKRFPFRTIAICLLPDHIHAILTLPIEDQNYSLRWKEIKRQFTKRYLSEIGDGELRNVSRQKRGEAAIWQRRFWEHTIWNDDDLGKHIDYIHFNPVKHGLVKQVKDWRWSSFHRYVREGFYDLDWGQSSELGIEKSIVG